MKLLFDQNVSPWLCRKLADVYPYSVHVREIGLREANDSAKWDYAKQNGFAILPKDADFSQRSFLMGHPPKVVWLRFGNCSTTSIEALLKRRAAALKEFLDDRQKSLLALS